MKSTDLTTIQKKLTRQLAKHTKRGIPGIEFLDDNTKLDMFYAELYKYTRILRVSQIPLNLEYGETTTGMYMFNSKSGSTIKICKAIKMFDRDLYNISILPCGKGVEIYRFETFQTGKGIGSYLLNILNEISLRLEMPLYLIPGTPGSGETFRADSDEKRRRTFYHKHGFKRMSVNTLYWKNSEAAKIDRVDICLNKI